MKKPLLWALLGLSVILACTKSSDELLDSSLESRGNDNHKIWNLAHVGADWNYTLTDGQTGSGSSELNYTYKCSRPFGRAIAVTDLWQENGAEIFNLAGTIAYNDNFKVAVEHATVNGDDIVRTFHYNANHQWTGITTQVNGVVLDDELVIGPGGLVQSYTHDGVRSEYIWVGENLKMIKTYVQPTAAMSKAQNSKVLGQLGFNKLANKVLKTRVLQSLAQIQKETKSSFRGKKTDEWVLVQIEEQEVDLRVIQPFSSPANGYPGSTGDGGFLALPKNFINKFTAYLVNPDGTRGDDVFSAHNHTYVVKNNLPENLVYSLKIPAFALDTANNPIDWNETGAIKYNYISGCNETSTVAAITK